MKESENRYWEEELLKDFKKPTHAGFEEEVMTKIEALEKKPIVQSAPLISLKQWFYVTLIGALIVLTAVFVQYRLELHVEFLETFSHKLLDWINIHIGTLWTLFSLVGVFFVYTLFNYKRRTFLK